MLLDFVTLACQLLGGVLGALLAGAFFGKLTLGPLGNALVGVVGGAAGGLILTSYLGLAPASLPDGAIGEPRAVLAHLASGAAGGAVLMIVVGYLKGLFAE